jgi:hypothetical protein
VLTGSYDGNYGPPPGFDWDVQLNDEPVEDNPKLETYNLPARVAEFVKTARRQVMKNRRACEGGKRGRACECRRGASEGEVGESRASECRRGVG